MGEVDISTALDRIKASTVKERIGGLDALKEILAYNRRNPKLDTLNDRSFHQIFEALFQFSSLERSVFLEAKTTQIRQLSFRRLESCASAIRSTVEISASRVQYQSVRALLDHVVQILPVGDHGYCEPLISDYLKSFHAIVDREAHVEHLSKELWAKAVDFCVTALQHVDNETGTKISFGSYGRTSSSGANGSMHFTPTASARTSSKTSGQALLSSRDLPEVMAILRRLTSASNSPIPDHSEGILSGVVTFLAAGRDRGPLSKATTAYHDAFATINRVIARTCFDNRNLVLETFVQLLPIIKEIWSSKESGLNQEILISLVRSLDYLPDLIRNPDLSFSAVDAETLMDVLYDSYSRRPERDSLGQLQVDDLNLFVGDQRGHEPFRVGMSLLRTGDNRSEMQWSIVNIIVHFSSMLDEVARHELADSEPGTPPNENVAKRLRRSQHLPDFLRRTDAPAIQLRAASLQILAFRLAQETYNEEDVKSVIEKLTTLASDENSEVSSWAIFGLSCCAFIEATHHPKFGPTWNSVWQIATRQVASVSHSVMAPSIESIISATDLHGPATLTDTSSSLLSAIAKQRSFESSSSYNSTCERILQWLQTRWLPGEFTNRTYASELARYVSAADVLRILYACTDRVWQNDWILEKSVIGHTCRVWLQRFNCAGLASYLSKTEKIKDEVLKESNLTARNLNSSNSQKGARVSSAARDGALLDFSITRLTHTSDRLALFAAKPQDLNADMIYLLTTLCLVAINISGIGDFQDVRRHDTLSRLSEKLSATLGSFVRRADFDDKNVSALLRVVASLTPKVSTIYSGTIDKGYVASFGKFAKVIFTALEDRTVSIENDGIDDELDLMDVDSGVESQSSHRASRLEITLERDELAASNDAQSLKFSTMTLLQFFSALNQDSTTNDTIPAKVLDHWTSISTAELLCAKWALVHVLASGLQYPVSDVEKLLEHFAGELLEPYRYERSEVALHTCLGGMMRFSTVWMNPSNEGSYEIAMQIYEWFIKTALPNRLLAPVVQMALADLLAEMMRLNADYGVDENLPSVRTTLFMILKTGEVPVKNHVARLIPEIFNLFVLAKHESIFADVLVNLPDNLDWTEGIAMRLLTLACLASKWHTLLRRCVYHIFETAGALPSSTDHAAACIRTISHARGLKNPADLFKLFAPQLLFTWLKTDQTLESIPFAIFDYSTLRDLLESNQEETVAQIAMRCQESYLESLSATLKTETSELLLGSIGKVAAYCIGTDKADKANRNTSEEYIRKIIGKDRLQHALVNSFHVVISQMFISLDRESEIAKVFQRRADFKSCLETLNAIKAISYSQTTLPSDQQPLFKSKYLLEQVDRLCRLLRYELSSLWTPPVLVYVLRSLLDTIDPALGSLHACSIIRKIRLIICMAGDISFQDYPLEMLLQALRPFLTDNYCADDTLGIVQYLFTRGKAALIDRPQFLANTALLILLSLRDFLKSTQDSTTQESQHFATMDRAQRFHGWLCHYLQSFPRDQVPEDLQKSFHALLTAACDVRGQGNAIEGTPESDLLKELLQDEIRANSLLERPSRDVALRALCNNFELPGDPRRSIFASDDESVKFSPAVLSLCQRVKVGDSFMLWASQLLGRSFASQGQFSQSESEPYDQGQKPAAKSQILSKSKVAIVQALLELFQSDQAMHQSYAEKSFRSMHMRFRTCRDPSAAVAFEQLLPSHINAALELPMSDRSFTNSPKAGRPQVKEALRQDYLLSPTVSLQVWVQTLTVLLARTASDDAILGALPTILDCVEGLAERIFPYVLHEVLLLEKGGDERMRSELSRFFNKWFKQKQDNSCKHIRILLHGLLHLRKEQVPGEETPLTRDAWLDVDFLLAASAACRCGMYTAALLLAENASPRDPGRSRRSSIVRVDVPSELLLEIYGNLDDPDAFYGVDQQPNLDTVMRGAEHESDGLKSLLYRAARVDSQLRMAVEPSADDYQGIVQSLNLLNVNSVTQSIASIERSNLGVQTAESLLEIARKLEQWDIRPPDSTQTASTHLFKAFQTFNINTEESSIVAGVETSLLECMKKLASGTLTTSLLRASLRVLASLSEMKELLHARGLSSVDEVWRNMRARQHWTALGQYVDVRHLMSCRETLFSSISKNVTLQHIVALNLRESRTFEMEALLTSSSTSRKHGAFQDSLATTTHAMGLIADCKKCGLEVEAAAKIELANVLWDQGEMGPSIKVLRGLQRQSHLDRQDIPVARSSLLAQIGRNVAEARLEKPDEVIREYLNPAVNALQQESKGENASNVYHAFATFCDQQLQNPDGQEDFERIRALRRQKKAEVDELSQLLKNDRLKKQRTSNENKQIKHQLSKAQQWYDIDNREYERLESSRNMLLKHSLENYLRTLQASDRHDTSVLQFFALWLENAESGIADDAVGQHLDQVPSFKFAVLMNQLSSRIQKQEKPFQNLLQSLVFRVCVEHPYHGMYHMFAGARTPGGSDESAISRHEAAVKLTEELRRSRSGKIWSKLYETNRALSKLATAPVQDLRERQGSRISLQKMPLAVQAANVATKERVPPATMSISLRPSGDYTDVPKIVRFEPSMQIASGLSQPKIITVIASDGKSYKQLYKGGNDELRQDAIMEQVFEEVSNLMRNHRETRRRNLRIRTYKVVPFGTSKGNHSGVIEFVQNAPALIDILPPRHEKYYPKDLTHSAARKKIQEASKTNSTDNRVKIYRQVAENFNPVMRFFFLEKFTDPDEWFERRLAYTRSTAAISILGHVLGLGDRHLQNILIDEISGEVVHIDLGVSFEAGRILPMPEVVPFRLTRDLVDGMGINGVEGVFRRCCEFMLDTLRREESSIMTLLNVLRYDPLYTWSISPLKADQMQKAQEDATNVAEGATATRQLRVEDRQENKNDGGEADRALSVVQRKLGKTLSTTATVNELIQQATDERNLAVLFAGWSSWV
ncbi:MAG: Serine/threonine-protein kinase tel1 [Bogoriella megaspora]|nr:MAG: Serine/threonine-protein kinase tel1 [Bogoriella megaspora]